MGKGRKEGRKTRDGVFILSSFWNQILIGLGVTKDRLRNWVILNPVRDRRPSKFYSFFVFIKKKEAK